MVSSSLSYGFQCFVIIKKINFMNNDVNMFMIRHSHEKFPIKIPSLLLVSVIEMVHSLHSMKWNIVIVLNNTKSIQKTIVIDKMKSKIISEYRRSKILVKRESYL